MLAPIAGNPDFLPSCQDLVFRIWREKGLDKVSKVLEGGVAQSFEELKIKYFLQNLNFFGYLQLQHFIFKNIQPPNFFCF